MISYNWNDAAYAELESEAAKDNRLGHQTFMVTEVRNETWPSGDPRIKVLGILTTANSAKCDLTVSPPPAPEVVKDLMATWEPAKKKAISQTITIYREMSKHYGKTPETLIAGDEINVNVVKNKEGFIRIASVLPPGDLAAKADASMPGF
jgi:hypothetical protein